MSSTVLQFPTTRTTPGAPDRDRRLRGDPFEVDLTPAIGGGVLLVGYDKEGWVAIEVRVKTECYSRETVDDIRRWLRREAR